MTSTFRLIMAGVVALFALFIGVLGQNADIEASSVQPARVVDPADATSSDEIDAWVERIVEAGLFPDAELYDAPDAESELSMEELQQAFTRPDLTAFVLTNSEWIILILEPEADPRTLRSGDTLIGDWQVAEVTATSVTVTRAGEERRLNAFPTGDE